MSEWECVQFKCGAGRFTPERMIGSTGSVWSRAEETETLFVSASNPQWVIKEESDIATGDMVSYPYHLKCAGSDDCHGWVSAWDVRNGVCYHCKEQVPEDIATLWQLQNSEVLGGYMYEIHADKDPAVLPDWKRLIGEERE